MADLIDRQAAIDALADYVHNVDKVYSTGKLSAEDCRDAAKSVLDELPSVQPQRQIGKWIDCSTPPDDDRNVFIARGQCDFISVCIGHYDHDSRIWYEDRNWFAKLMYDEMFWTEIPDLPTGGAKMEVEHED